MKSLYLFIFAVMLVVLSGCKVWTKDKITHEIAWRFPTSDIFYFSQEDTTPDINTVHTSFFVREYEENYEKKATLYVMKENFYGVWEDAILKKVPIIPSCQGTKPTSTVGIVHGDSGIGCLQHTGLPLLEPPCSSRVLAAYTSATNQQALWLLACNYSNPDIGVGNLEGLRIDNILYRQMYLVKDSNKPHTRYLEKHSLNIGIISYDNIFGDTPTSDKKMETVCLNAHSREIDHPTRENTRTIQLFCDEISEAAPSTPSEGKI